jgi:hypothetical protein
MNCKNYIYIKLLQLIRSFNMSVRKCCTGVNSFKQKVYTVFYLNKLQKKQKQDLNSSNNPTLEIDSTFDEIIKECDKEFVVIDVKECTTDS